MFMQQKQKQTYSRKGSRPLPLPISMFLLVALNFKRKQRNILYDLFKQKEGSMVSKVTYMINTYLVLQRGNIWLKYVYQVSEIRVSTILENGKPLFLILIPNFWPLLKCI